MRPLRLEFSPGALLLIALLYFFDSLGIVAAAVPAVMIHEFGHFIMLTLCGCRVTRLRLGFFGMEMDYAGMPDPAQMLCSTALGPVAGAIYGAAALMLPGRYFRLSGMLSLLLSGFNLLPILPLDGGRIAATMLGEKRAERLGRCASALLLIIGLALLPYYHVWMLPAMAAWLTVRNFRG